MKILYKFIIFIFAIAVTCTALCYNWPEFYEGYSFCIDNLYIGIIFLLAWLIFSLFFGLPNQRKYIKYISIYWSIDIITSLLFWIFSNTQFSDLVLYPFYIWYSGPLYGFRLLFYNVNTLIDRPALALVTAPLGLITCFIGYGLGMLVKRFKKSKTMGTR
ncbi:hypothetical protein [Inconstantimicrobium mannanitabidum]|uniref:Uncharacterized protein n=1 Tax=Inconstantimicrobium mannanitabidum TaxID=1604901 RepID=A0ACB5RGH7_9CLOT|nr:hypothetical protein [Clostridium sp. TW13]GKX68179.1 hypothetical protein rsdtw13_34370 [Clostridium sp. TW13]